MHRPALVATLVGLALACSSGPSEGDYCEDTWPQCKDEHTALWCDYGVFRPFSCPGPDGCVATVEGGQRVSSCDVRGTVAGDHCISVFSGFIMCQTASSALKCNGSNWVAKECSAQSCVNGETGIGTIESRGTCN
jgi:hypothetical protein